MERLVLEGKQQVDIWFRRNGMQSLNGIILAQMVDKLDEMLSEARADMTAEEFVDEIRKDPRYKFIMELVQRAYEIEEKYKYE